MKKRVTQILSLVAVWLFCLNIRGDFIAYFSAVDEETGCRYVQASELYSEYTVDEYYYDGDKYDGDIEININIPNVINGIPIRSVGGYNYKISDKIRRYHDSATGCDYRRRMPFSIIADNFFDENCNLIINFYIPQNVKEIYFGQFFSMYSKSMGETRSYKNISFNFIINKYNQYLYFKNGKLLYKENDNEVLNLVSDTIMKEDLMDKEECPHICVSFFN